MKQVLFILFFSSILAATAIGQSAPKKGDKSVSPLVLKAKKIAPKFFQTDSAKKANGGLFGVNLKPIIGLDNYNSQLFDANVNFLGIRVGIEILNRMRFGIGYHGLTQPIDITQIMDSLEPFEFNYNYHFGYVNAFFELIFINNYRWELSFLGSAGAGVGKQRKFTAGREIAGYSEEDWAFVLVNGAVGYYKIWPFLGVGLGLGYRYTYLGEGDSQKLLSQRLSNGYWAIKVKIKFGKLYRALLYPEEFRKEKDEWRNSRRR